MLACNIISIQFMKSSDGKKKFSLDSQADSQTLASKYRKESGW